MVVKMGGKKRKREREGRESKRSKISLQRATTRAETCCGTGKH